MHAADVRRQFILSMEWFPSCTRATLTRRNLAPEVRLFGGMKRCVMSSQLSLTGKGTACAFFVVTHEPAIIEYGANFTNNFIQVEFVCKLLGYRGGCFSLLCVYPIFRNAIFKGLRGRATHVETVKCIVVDQVCVVFE